jgi:hypothetical protein
VDLTAIERTWLEAAAPVLSYARAQRLPLDIIVQPQPTPGETPLGMAFVDGRCKLVLSMRGNPEDYDEWGSLGLEDWSFEKCLPAFKAIETDTKRTRGSLSRR